MRPLTNRASALAVATLVVLALPLLWPLAQRAAVRLTGAVMPDSTRTLSYSDKRVRALSVGGERWRTWGQRERGAAYHALIVLPSVPLADGGGLTRVDDFTHTNIQKWSMPTGPGGAHEERQLEVTYDALRRAVTLGQRSYSLAGGNLFVIHLDERWEPRVTQLGVSINVEVEADLDLFKSLMRGDEALQRL